MGSSTIIASGMSSASSATVGTQPKLSRTKETGDSSEVLMEGRNGMRDRSDRATAASLHFKYLMVFWMRIQGGAWEGQS